MDTSPSQLLYRAPAQLTNCILIFFSLNNTVLIIKMPSVLLLYEIVLVYSLITKFLTSLKSALLEVSLPIFFTSLHYPPRKLDPNFSARHLESIA